MHVTVGSLKPHYEIACHGHDDCHHAAMQSPQRPQLNMLGPEQEGESRGGPPFINPNTLLTLLQPIASDQYPECGGADQMW